MPQHELTQTQSKEKKRVAGGSVLAAVFLTCIKLGVGIATGSLGILSEAAHSALDLGAAFVTYLAVRISDRPADLDHHYGHGKVENLSALVETFLLFVVCAWIIYEAVQRMFFRPIEVKLSWLGLIVMIVAIVVDFTRYRALSRVAKKYQSQALEADALHFSSDILGSSVVILGLLFVWIGIPIADPLAALGVALLVIIVSIRLGKRAVDVLLDKAPTGIKQKIEQVVKSFPQIENWSRLRVRRSGASFFVDMNISLDRNTSFESVHQIASQVEKKILSFLPRADIVVHTDPVKGKSFIDRKLDLSQISEKEKSEISAIIDEHIKDFVEFHDLTFHKLKSQKLVNFHLVLPKDIRIEEAHRLCDHLEKDIKERIGDSTVVIHVEPCDGECETCRRTCEKSE